MVAAAVTVVVLYACFGLLIWVGLLNRIVFSSTSQDSIAARWPGLTMASWPDRFMTYNILHTVLLAGAGYLIWSGTEPFTPSSLNASYQGRFYTVMMAFYFIYVAIDLLILTTITSLKEGERVAATVFSGISWVIVLVMAFVCGDMWSFQWEAQRALGLAIWLIIPVLTLNSFTIFLLCGFDITRFSGVLKPSAAAAAFHLTNAGTKQAHLKF